jgi:hypothetical protein
MSTLEVNDLRTAVENRDAEALWSLVPALEQSPESVPLLSSLLLEDWHESHEDIVFTLGLIGDARAIGAIERAVTIPFNSLVKHGNLPEFQRKCAYALARIATEESRLALERLAGHSDAWLREYGAEGLQKWPLPYRPQKCCVGTDA